MAEFVRQYIGLRELARRAKAAAQLVEEAEIDIDLLILGTIERARGGFRAAASGFGVIAEQHEFRVVVLHAGLLRQELRPSVLHVVEDKGDELHQGLLGLVLRGIWLAERSLCVLLFRRQVK